MRKLIALSITVFALYLFVTYKNSNNAENMGNLYNHFQNNFGQDAKIAPPQEVADRNGLQKQLESVKEMVGKWDINPRFVIPSDSMGFTIRYRLETEQARKFDITSV